MPVRAIGRGGRSGAVPCRIRSLLHRVARNGFPAVLPGPGPLPGSHGPPGQTPAVWDGARTGGVPVIYATVSVNGVPPRRDHREDTRREERGTGRADPAGRRFPPDDESLFVVRARHSIFYETPLGHLLSRLGADHVVLCGQVTEQCVLHSALDAHIRQLRVSVPEDAVAPIHRDLAEVALRMMARNMRATVRTADTVDF
ncbi:MULTISPECIES: isochorismatase family cysteine hydrolase [unclassified Streptomyces]|uniref:isochorismatase family cysteine hydrolase n=1 Tax=unclassified Streptomyces TaxID=2593676 RepID=UPI0009969555|nr:MULTISPECIES: isochorismatase family cysteine hydrolase [unclassified Streptomyces]